MSKNAPSVIPHFLRNQQRGQQDGPPVARVQRHAREGNQTIDKHLSGTT
jgi:hypothetical protein